MPSQHSSAALFIFLSVTFALGELSPPATNALIPDARIRDLGNGTWDAGGNILVDTKIIKLNRPVK